jgi:mono/diheme cytochrome c family protein
VLAAAFSCSCYGVGFGPGPGAGVQTVATTVCSTGQQWAGGGEGSADMYPGQACVACHRKGEGPVFVIAGTVFKTPNEADNCVGATTGVSVQITDANGKVETLAVSATGNFSSSKRGVALVMPYTAKVLYAGGERVMSSAQSDGDCNVCHTAAGLNGAPGRVSVP